MKRVAYKSFASKEKVIVETTGYKDCEGKSVWADANGMVYELSYARLSRAWAVCPIRTL